MCRYKMRLVKDSWHRAQGDVIENSFRAPCALRLEPIVRTS
jgi:hypothetical protein